MSQVGLDSIFSQLQGLGGEGDTSLLNQLPKVVSGCESENACENSSCALALSPLTPLALPQEVRSGTRKVIWAFGVLPLPMGLFPFYSALWGIQASLLHLIFEFTLAGILAEILLLKFQKVPFTCSYLPGKANLKLYWFPYFASFLLYAYGMAPIERTMLEYPVRFVIFYAAAFAVLCYLTFRRGQLPLSERTVIFEEQPEPAVRTLNLGH